MPGLAESTDHSTELPVAVSRLHRRLRARENDPGDGRRVLVTATPADVKFAAEAGRRWHAWLDDRLAELTASQRATVLEAALILCTIADS